jgi:hypothetical protein
MAVLQPDKAQVQILDLVVVAQITLEQVALEALVS